MSKKKTNQSETFDRFSPSAIITERAELGATVLKWREGKDPDTIEADGLTRGPDGVEPCLYKIVLTDDESDRTDFSGGEIVATCPRTQADAAIDRAERDHAFAMVSRDTMIGEKAEREEKLRDKAKHVSRLRAQYEQAKLDAKLAKDRLDSASQELEELATSELRPPLFRTEQEAESSEEWRMAPVDHLDIAEGLKAKLKDGGITTIGELADFTRPLSDIKGIGQAASEVIADAAQDWHARRVKSENDAKTQARENENAED